MPVHVEGGIAVIVHHQSIGFPQVPAMVHRSPNGVPYLREPGVAMLSVPHVCLENLSFFLSGFDEELGFQDYLNDPVDLVPPGTQLSKAAGQLCYFAFGPGRTRNAEAPKYIRNIKDQKHGSVLEHPNFSVLLYGISRSLTHELVRHRAGMAFSQVSQRYVDGKILRFVMRPEYQGDPEFEHGFFVRIERAAAEYETLAQLLLQRQTDGSQILSGEKKRDLRKKVNQAARSLLPNETEAPIIVTANARAWRHVLEMRASDHAEVEIRRAAMRVFECLRRVEAIIFDDYTIRDLPDGTQCVTPEFVKV